MASIRISIYQKFFTFMEKLGLMKGAKAFPCEPQKEVYHDKRRQEYIIPFKRSPGVPF